MLNIVTAASSAQAVCAQHIKLGIIFATNAWQRPVMKTIKRGAVRGLATVTRQHSTAVSMIIPVNRK